MYSMTNIKIVTKHVCKQQQILRHFSLNVLLHFSNFLMVEHIEVKLGTHEYYIISMTNACFHDDLFVNYNK